MKIAAVQAAIAYGDVEKNYALAAENIKKAAAAGAGLVVLSELWNTSFYPPDIMDLADRDGVRTQAFLAEEAKRYGVHIVGGSVANRRGDNLYNTTFVVNKAG